MPLKNAAECLLWTTMLYAAGLAAFADHIGPAGQWLRAMDGAVAPLLFIAEPTDQPSEPTALLYRHVLLVCVLVTSGWIWIGRHWVPGWAATFWKYFADAILVRIRPDWCGSGHTDSVCWEPVQ